MGIQVRRQEKVDDYILDFWTTATKTSLIITIANQEEFMPYASVFAHRAGGAFFNTYQKVEALLSQNPNISKIFYFGNDNTLQPTLSSLVSNYGKNLHQIPTIAEAEESLVPRNFPNTKNIVTVIHKDDNSTLEDDREYWKLAPIYAAFRQTMLITVNGTTTEDVDKSIDSELDQNIISHNRDKEPDYLIIIGHWTTIPYRFRVEGFDLDISADARYADRNEDGYYVPDIAFGRFTAYNLGDVVLLMNKGPFFDSKRMESLEKGVWVTDFENHLFYNVKERLEEMLGPENTYSKVSSPPLDRPELEKDAKSGKSVQEFLNEAKSAKLVFLEGHGSPYGISILFPGISGDNILKYRFYSPSLWSFEGCDTGPYSPDGVSLVRAAIQSGAVNVLSAVTIIGTGSSWGSWYTPYLARGYDIGSAYLKGQKDAEIYFNLPPSANKQFSPTNKYPQVYLIGDPLVSYGTFCGPAASPTVGDNWLEGIEINQAIPKGTLFSLGGDGSAQVWVEWGETKSYGNTTLPQTKTSPGDFFITITDLSPGTTYHFRTVAKNNVGISHGPDVKFTFPEKAITVISPNGGETWVMGKTYDITWSSTNVDKVYIQLPAFKEGVSVGAYSIAQDFPASLGKYSWKIPHSSNFEKEYRYKVAIEDAAPRSSGAYDPTTLARDESNDYFTIIEK